MQKEWATVKGRQMGFMVPGLGVKSRIYGGVGTVTERERETVIKYKILIISWEL